MTNTPLPSDDASVSEKLIVEAFARLDRVALGIAFGTTFGLLLFAATLVLLVKGGDPLGPHLELLSQFLIGYEVSALGSLIGLGYGTLIGFVLGWIVAFLHNLFVTLYLYLVKFKADISSATDVIDFP